ncbi:MAG: type II secretion system minor pseudopilin GspH [Gammaproteobacteria bacterium SHHR-1]
MPSFAKGFTLLELMVSLFIVGILMGTLLLRIGDSSEQRLEMEAKRLQALLQLASEEAVMTSRELGLELFTGAYGFVLREGDAWVRLEQDSQLRQRELPPGIDLELELEGEPIRLLAQADPDRPLPQILIDSSGELPLFCIRLRSEKGRGIELQPDLHGELGWALTNGTQRAQRSAEGAEKNDALKPISPWERGWVVGEFDLSRIAEGRLLVRVGERERGGASRFSSFEVDSPRDR